MDSTMDVSASVCATGSFSFSGSTYAWLAVIQSVKPASQSVSQSVGQLGCI